jgi:hypothetical protein
VKNEQCKKYILESLKDQREIFGDILYEKPINIDVKERKEIKSDRWHVAEKQS